MKKFVNSRNFMLSLWSERFYIMTKAELVAQVAKSTGVDRSVVLEVVNSMSETVKDAMARKEAVYLRGFGSFVIKTRAEKAARHIKKNVTMTVEKHDIAVFKPSREFAEKVWKC